MLKKILPLSVLPLLLAGCAANLTNLTPKQQVQKPDNLYRVEVALSSRQQAMRWDSIKPQIVVGNQLYPMRPTPLMTNRWEGLIPVPPGATSVKYHYQFDFDTQGFGKAHADSVRSEDYVLKVIQ